MGLRITLVWLIALGLSGAARAEDGYDLWLRYAPIEDAGCAMLTGRRLPAWSSSSRRDRAQSSRRSWQRGLKGLLGDECRGGRRSTPGRRARRRHASSPIVLALGWGGR